MDCFDEESRRKRILQILADESIDGDVVTRDFLMMCVDAGDHPLGRHASGILWGFPHGCVIVVDSGRGGGNFCYSIEELEGLAFDAMEMGSFDAAGTELDGDERADSIYEYFGIGLDDCRVELVDAAESN